MPLLNASFDRRRFLSTAAMSFMGSMAGLTRLLARSGSENLPVEGQMPYLKHAHDWLNTRPLESADLLGKVVLVNFCTYTCINWLRTLPYVRAWAGKYQSQGLAVIGVHTPEFSIEHDITNVRASINAMQVAYPIAIDNDHAIWRAFENEYWPALYFVDAKGQIRYHRFGEGEYEQSELVIQKLLREAGAVGIDDRFVTADSRGIEAPADWNNLHSSENYVGKTRTKNFVSSRERHRFKIPTELDLNQWALEGDWTIGKEAIVLNKTPGRIAYRFHARDLHLVMSPEAPGNSVRFRVSIDGQAPGLDHGGDIDAEGRGTLTEPRLYQLIRQSKPIQDRRFEIEFPEGGAQAFAFTFG